jgi:non-heme chloroperoxidase
LVRTSVLGEPLAISLLKDDPQYCYAKDVDMIRENAFKHSLVQEAMYRAETEKVVRIFLDGVIGKEGYFYQLTCEARTMIMQNVKSLTGELASIPQHFTGKDAQRVKVPTLLVKGEQNPKLLHHITDLLANCLPNNEQTTIPGQSHELGRIEKPEVFNTNVLEFLSKYK